MNPWLLERMACPRHHGPLTQCAGELVCASGCRFPVVDGMPVMLIDELPETIRLATPALKAGVDPRGLYLDTLGLSDQEKRGVLELSQLGDSSVDPVVSFLVAATNGNAYRALIGKLEAYPIPDLRLPPGNGKVLIDLGCSWGRWSIAAARAGYKVIGIDPSLGAVMAARRVARQLGVDAEFIVGDARVPPLASASADVVFSYSVLQHLSPEETALAIGQMARVLKSGGKSLVQMPTKLGIRCLYQQARRGFREARGFEVRYWSLGMLRRAFARPIGPTTFSVDCFFGIGLQPSDRRMMSPMMRATIAASEALRRASRVIPPLVWFADSVYVTSVHA